MEVSRNRLIFTLVVLFGINTMNFYDRQVVGAVGEKVRQQWSLNDKQLSGLTTAFILLYAAVGLPLGHWADVGRRKIILSGGVLVWSLFTILSGRARDYPTLFFCRLGVGVGEASCAPAANSLLGDLFPPHRRARAIALFMLGLPIGLGSSYIISGYLTKALTWNAALYVAGLPGLILGILAFWLPEPERGSAEVQPVSTKRQKGSNILTVLRIPTMWWIILSGALLNLSMYALGSFLTSLLMRYHHMNIVEANWISGIAYGFGGGLGMLAGGWLGDRIAKRRVSGRMELAALAMLLATPGFWLALQQPEGAYWRFAACLLPACMCLYFYYSTVYATIQDIVVPTMRGTAMAVYFFVFYMVAAVGLYWFGWLSDHYKQQVLVGDESILYLACAHFSGCVESPPWEAQVLTHQKEVAAQAIGLHQAMYVIPVFTAVLTLVLWAGSRTVGKDYRRLHGETP
jgi:predicted MFS family arabinose efflux permease